VASTYGKQVDIVAVHGLGESDNAWVYISKRSAKNAPDPPGKRRGSEPKTDRKGQTQSKAADGAARRDATKERRAESGLAPAIPRDVYTSEWTQSLSGDPPPILETGNQSEKLPTVLEDETDAVLPVDERRRSTSIGPRNESHPLAQADTSRMATGSNFEPTSPLDHQDKPSADVREEEAGDRNVLGSSRHSADYSKKQDGRVHWLNDPNMLPKAIPNVRVLLYSYEDPPNINSQRSGQAYVENTAKDLIKRIQAERRPEKDYENVPIVFICHGFGSVIVLKAMELIEQASEKSKDESKETKDESKSKSKDESKETKVESKSKAKNESKETKGESKSKVKDGSEVGVDAISIAVATAGIMFLEVPPVASVMTPLEKPWMFPDFPLTLERLGNFFHEKHGKGICTAWFYDLEATPAKVRLVVFFVKSEKLIAYRK